MPAINVETVNGCYSAFRTSTGGVCATRRAGDIVHIEYTTEEEWRNTICDFSVRGVCIYLDAVSDADPGDDQDVIRVRNALNMLRTIHTALLRRHPQELFAIWHCMNRASITWSHITTIATKIQAILDTCEDAIELIYSETVPVILRYIDEHNDDTWKPLAIELIELVKQPHFRRRTDPLVERVHIRAVVRRWMTWTDEEAFLEICRAFLADFTICIA